MDTGLCFQQPALLACRDIRALRGRTALWSDRSPLGGLFLSVKETAMLRHVGKRVALRYQPPVLVGPAWVKSLGVFQGRTCTPGKAVERASTGWAHHTVLRIPQKRLRKAEKVTGSYVSCYILLCLSIENEFWSQMKNACQIRQ